MKITLPVLFGLASLSLFAQNLPQPKNLRLLDPKSDVMTTMESFRTALGVQCTFCHLQDIFPPVATDFASDANPRKQTARSMISMTREINAKFPDGKQRVTCYSCHRGDIKPRLEAAAPVPLIPLPRTADGKPDMSGVWQATGTPAGSDVGSPGGIVGGGLVPYQPWAEAKYKEYNAAFGKDDPASRCLPPGPPRINYIFPIQIVQKPGLIVTLHEYMHVFRVIHTDGRPHPKDPNPTYKGDSVAHWEGDTLVVDVMGFNPGWFDQAGNFYTDALHVVERYTLTDAETIAYEVTLEDTKAYTRPWKMAFKFKKRPANFELMEYQCSENEKDIPHLVGK